MPERETALALSLALLLVAGCGKSQKSTDELIADLKSSHERDRIVAVRLLPERKEDAAKIVPAMIESLKDKDGDVRVSAAIGLGSFGEVAKPAIDGLRAAERDRDARVRRAAGVAVNRIDPSLAPLKTAGENLAECSVATKNWGGAPPRARPGLAESPGAL